MKRNPPMTREDEVDYFRYKLTMENLIKELKRIGKYNPSYNLDINKFHDMAEYQNKCAFTYNDFSLALHGKNRVEFLADMKKYDLSPDTLEIVFDALMTHNCFKYYAAIEFIIGKLVKDVLYEITSNNKTKEYKISGNETLGQLKNHIERLLPNNDFFWDEIDIKFRNALAHGWYFMMGTNLVYYTNSKLESPIKLQSNNFILKLRTIALMTFALVDAI